MTGPIERSSRAPILALLAVLVVFVTLSTLIALKTPAWEANDEPGHVQNVEAVVSGHWYSMPAKCVLDPKIALLFDCAGSEPQQPPLYYLLAAGWQKALDLPTQPAYRGSINPGLYLDLHSPALTNDHSANHGFVMWLRYLSIAMGALTVLVSFFAVRLLASDPWTPVVAAAILAFIPRFVFLAPFVTNDILVALLGACLMFVSLRFARSPSWWWTVAIGGVYGLLILTKFSTLPMGLVIVADAFLVTGWRRRTQVVAVGVGCALVASGWNLVLNTVRYGDPLALSATRKYLTTLGGLGVTGGRPYSVSDPVKFVLIKVPQQLVHSLWFQSGWGQFNWPSWVNWTITVVAIVLIATVIHRYPHRDVLIVLGTLAVAGPLCVWMTAFSTGDFAGRYAVAGFPAIAALVALALERWRLPIRFILPALGVVGTVVAFNADVLAVHWT